MNIELCFFMLSLNISIARITKDFSGKDKVSLRWEAPRELSPPLEQVCSATRLSPHSGNNDGNLDKTTKLSPYLVRIMDRTMDKLFLSQVLAPLQLRQVSGGLDPLQPQQLEVSFGISNTFWVEGCNHHSRILL